MKVSIKKVKYKKSRFAATKTNPALAFPIRPQIYSLLLEHHVMLLKSADNKDSQISVLKNLLDHKNVSAEKKQQIERELRNLLAGIATEKQAAYDINFYFGQSKNVIVLHDLRLQVNGRVAQIDHLLMNRAFDVFVLETKTYSTGLSINENGEFSTSYDGRDVGISSPIEQNNRHIAVLQDAFKQVGLPKRLGIAIQPFFHSVTLVSSKGTISRPKKSKVDLNGIVKSDQFFSWYKEKLNETKISDVVGILKICSSDTIKELGEKLVALHQPSRIDYVKKFDLADALLRRETQISQISVPDAYNKADHNRRDEANYFCAACRRTIAEVVAKFCWNNKSRFAGKAYCRSCQSKF